MYTAKKQLIIVYSSLGIAWLVLMLVIFSFVLTGCSKEVLGGSGKVVTEKRQPGDFTDVVVDGTFIVILHESDTTEVTIRADDNLMRTVETFVSGTTLHIKLKDGVRVVHGNTMQIDLKSPVYHSVTYKAGRVLMPGDTEGTVYNVDTLHTDHFTYTVNSNNNAVFLVKTPKLDLFLNGNGHISVRGTADDYHCEVNGNADINGIELASADANIKLNGSGKHSIIVSNTLDAVVKGSGKIQYLGDPVVHSEVQGSGSVEKY
jgi:hypothetical protein